MFCRKCGKQINDDASFCPFCGYTVGEQYENTSDSAVQACEVNSQFAHSNAEISKGEFLALEENAKLKRAFNIDCILTYILCGLWIIGGFYYSVYFFILFSIAIIAVTIVLIQKKYNYIGGIVVLVLYIVSICPLGIGVGISLIRNLIKIDKSYREHISG